ncbi:thiamine pyrophosphate-dependent enzyme [Bacillus badius]|uniref:Acetolactate synthase large subunit n=1 Tax=Bacillus badius TaxID=1455 RepID=A0ABR5AUZ2_BACBA|nr:thiamine pyrophosphate-dependent enzyme [Bacillus badius]KIL76303.1 Acetolactate synthase large subunit [Bacillus badius]KIL78420.1 Acetolactate synthase large subunit [Bacillus badius]MED4716077.1 thiamine pyrophosphate-binding protein [Bacillus badius]
MIHAQSVTVEKLTGGQGVVACLKRERVSKVFCVPGESYLPVMDAIYDEPSIELISCRHEGGASFMAEGYAKASGEPGVVMATRAVGGANLAIGIHTAYQDSTPMVVFLGQVHTAFRGREGFQEVELDQFFSHIAKWTVEINDAARVPELVTRAFKTARSGRPGPVVVSLPEDMLRDVAEMAFSPAMERSKPAPSLSELEKAGVLLKEAKRPIIIAGGGVIRANAEKELLSFAEAAGIPVMASFRRHDVFPNHHPLYAGHLGLGTPLPIIETAKQADVILTIGSRLSEITSQDYSLFNKEQQLIHIDISEETIGKTFIPAVGMLADAKEALDALAGLELTIQAEAAEWAAERRRVFEKCAAAETAERAAGALSYRQSIQLLQSELPAETIFTNDAGNFATWLHNYFCFTQANTYIGPTSGAMGYGIPAAIGAKLARPHTPVVSLSGDGGAMMTIQELETAVRYNLPVICIIYNNQMYGTIRMHQEIHYPEKVVGTELGNVNFVLLAQSMGASGELIETADQFKAALHKAIESKTPALLELRMDPEQISVSKTITELRQSNQ